MARSLPVAGLLFVAAIVPATAQQPTQQQRDAIRSACRSDFMANCASVTPGGKEAFECLLKNQAKLSAACNSAVTAVAQKPAEPAIPAPAEPSPAPTAAAPAAPAPAKLAPPPATAASASQEDQVKTVRKACTLDDIAAHCSWIAPSNPELLLCLHANLTDLSPACQSAVQALPAATAPTTAPTGAAPKKPAAARAATPPPAASPAAAAPGKPTAQQTGAIRAACRSDFMSHCSGVQPGGAEALQCLQRNAASVSVRCRSAVAAIGIGAPAGSPAAAAGASAAATPAVAPLTPRPFIMLERRLFIMRICRADAESFCGGAVPDRRRMIDCLAANASSLSPPCYNAVASVSR
jgi:hypothetical protein